MRIFLLLLCAVCAHRAALAAAVDLSKAIVMARPGPRTEAETTAATVLVEEVEKRTGVRLAVSDSADPWRIAIRLSGAGERVGAEGFRLTSGPDGVRIASADARGALFGVGEFLRRARFSPGRLEFADGFDFTTAPTYPIRGHQLGYRATANSWDAWTVAQFDQYIRELALFGANSIENIPLQDTRTNPLMKVPRREMNRAMSAICRKYGLDYWVWTPADFDLNDAGRRAAALRQFEELFQESATLTGVFVPGGDPGSNPPDLVLAFLEDLAKLLAPRHPEARLWLSLQGFDRPKEEAVYRYIEQRQPSWLGGLVAGPSSPPAARTRQRLPARYKLRLYPDLTHNKICQFQVPGWDQAFALTLGREAVNPRAAEFAAIHNRQAPYSDGFISYSDGVHDDVNKAIWAALAWNPAREAREVLRQYANLFFGTAMADQAADAILALERNWRGPIQENGAIEATLLQWRQLEKDAPGLSANWRWQMCLLRAVYDAYVRRRALQDAALERQANRALLDPALDSAQAVARAGEILRQAALAPAGPELRQRILELCEDLFRSIGLQTSVGKYHASGAERGAVLDFVDLPLNNRWWLEDEWAKALALPSEPERRGRLREIALWEDPGPGGFYDDIGHEARSPRVDGDAEQDPDSFRGAEPTFWWWDNGRSRARLSWQTTMWPRRMVYEALDPSARYVVRTYGHGQSLLRVDGQRVEASMDQGARKEFRVPPEQVRDGKLVLTWDIPTDEEHLNWRQRSRLAEVWLIRQP